jgi:hypothetical protein
MAMGQSYCSPTFDFGCSGWRCIALSVGTIEWTNAQACTVSDYSAMSATVAPGIPASMLVENGAWCGVSVWVDLDNSFSFEANENLYHTYVGGSPSHIYEFDITVPPGTPSGPYRMRVISPWGSDGFTEGSQNGYGPCGNFQYGNFLDFTLVVDASNSIDVVSAGSSLVVGPNPTTGPIFVDLPGAMGTDHFVQVIASDGKVAIQHSVNGDQRVQLDLSGLASGAYQVQSLSNNVVRSVRVVKE